MWAIPTGTSLVKKKIQVKSPSIWSSVSEIGSDPPIGSDRDSGRDRLGSLNIPSWTWKKIRLWKRIILRRKGTKCKWKVISLEGGVEHCRAKKEREQMYKYKTPPLSGHPTIQYRRSTP